MQLLTRLAVIVLILAGLTCPVSAATRYPNKPVQIIMGFGAGGVVDQFWRTIKEDLESVLKVPLVLVSKPGAGGLLAADAVANVKKDGYTLMSGSTTLKTIVPAMNPRDVRDVDFLAICFRTPFALTVRNESRFRSLKEVIDYTRNNPQAGLTVGTPGVQTESRWDLEIMMAKAGVAFTHVPTPDISESLANLLGGHIDFWFGTVTGILPLYKAGRLRMLAIVAPRRLPEYPDIPTFGEQGFPEADIDFTVGLLGPKNLPQNVVSTWDAALKQVLGKPATQTALRKLNIYVDPETDPGKIDRALKEQFDRVARIVSKEGSKK